MNSFISNRIELNNDSVASRLTEARINKKITLEKVAEKLKINKKYLKALEGGKYENLPRGVYGKNFLREYAQFLKIDSTELLKLFDQETSEINALAKTNIFSRKIPKNFYFLTIPRIIKNFVITLVIIICLLYLGYYVKNIISPPSLNISYPTDDLITSDKSVEIKGATEIEAEVMINKKSILIDKNGNFSEIVNLANGLNTITISARKKYSKENLIIKKILVKENIDINY